MEVAAAAAAAAAGTDDDDRGEELLMEAELFVCDDNIFCVQREREREKAADR